MKKILLPVFIVFTLANVQAGSDTVFIKVKVTDKDNPFVWVNYMAVNKRTKQGSFGNRDGVFEMRVMKSDTIVVQSRGYYEKIFTMNDSAYRNQLSFTLVMEKKPIELKEVVVKPERTFKEIEDDIRTVKKENTSDYSKVHAAENMITYLYERFSNIGRQKAQVAEMEYHDRVKELLHELMTKYVNGGLIDLDKKEFDSFIAYCRFNLEFVRNSSQYDLIVYVQERFEDYKIATRKP